MLHDFRHPHKHKSIRRNGISPLSHILCLQINLPHISMNGASSKQSSTPLWNPPPDVIEDLFDDCIVRIWRVQTSLGKAWFAMLFRTPVAHTCTKEISLGRVVDNIAWALVWLTCPGLPWAFWWYNWYLRLQGLIFHPLLLLLSLLCDHSKNRDPSFRSQPIRKLRSICEGI